MKRVALGFLVGLLLVGVSFAAFAGKPLVRAHGELKTDLHFAGQWLDLHFSFNVKDCEDADQGNLSMRIFDHWSGKLIAVALSYGTIDVSVVGDWVIIWSPMRTSFFDTDYYLPVHRDQILFQAYDGGNVDQFKLFNVPLTIHQGKVIIR